jgi:hypothetical protein
MGDESRLRTLLCELRGVVTTQAMAGLSLWEETT